MSLELWLGGIGIWLLVGLGHYELVATPRRRLGMPAIGPVAATWIVWGWPVILIYHIIEAWKGR